MFGIMLDAESPVGGIMFDAEPTVGGIMLDAESPVGCPELPGIVLLALPMLACSFDNSMTGIARANGVA